MQIELYRAGVTKRFKRFEELTDSDRLSVFPVPTSSKTFNICMEVDWETKDKTSGGSGFKYLLITYDNLHNLATNILTGWDLQHEGKITVVRILGDVHWAVKLVYPDILAQMLPWSTTNPNVGPLTQFLLDDLIERALHPNSNKEIPNVNYH